MAGLGADGPVQLERARLAAAAPVMTVAAAPIAAEGPPSRQRAPFAPRRRRRVAPVALFALLFPRAPGAKQPRLSAARYVPMGAHTQRPALRIDLIDGTLA